MQLQSSLAQSQYLKLTITPQLKQSMHILQVPADELSEFLYEQCQENPLLEFAWPSCLSSRKNSKNSLSGITDNGDLFEHLSRPSETLESMLLSQMRLNGVSGKAYLITKFLAGNLNECGYINVLLDEVSEACSATMPEVQRALYILQSLEPAGIGARNLQECLQLQIERDPMADTFAYSIVTDYFTELAKGRLNWIAGRLNISEDKVNIAVGYIRSLNPRPGLSFIQQTPVFVQPDAIVRKHQAEYVIVMNRSHLPKLSINEHYVQLKLKSEYNDAINYIKSHLQAAEWLIRCLEQRTSTLQKVIESIVAEQKAFLEGGIQYLKPIKQKLIAAKLGLHESTISRATQNKYIQTPQGFFELKYFFTVGLTTIDGRHASSESIKAKIKHLIEMEDKGNPLSDQKITEQMVNEGIQISRRTVMNYREELNLLSSRLRY